jgi:hypothetical protein
LLFSFVPMSYLFHSSRISETASASQTDPTAYLNEGDPYFETHPESHGAAWQAAHGSWASQGAPLASDEAAYTPIGKLRSNGTHDFERTVLMISLDGVRYETLNVSLNCSH